MNRRTATTTLVAAGLVVLGVSLTGARAQQIELARKEDSDAATFRAS